MNNMNKIFEDEEQQAEKALQQLLQRQHLETMSQTVTVAVAQMKRLVPQNLSTWIKTSLTLSNVEDIKAIYLTTLNEVVHKYRRGSFQGSHFEEFTNSVNDGSYEMCKAPLEYISRSLSKFIRSVNQALEKNGCFSSDAELKDLCFQETQRTCEELCLPSNFCKITTVEVACQNLTNLLCGLNQQVYQKEKALAEQISAEVKSGYDVEMARFFTKNPSSDVVLRGMHSLLKDQFLKAFDHAFCTNSMNQHTIRGEMISKLGADLNNIFLSYQNANEKQMKIFLEETKKNMEQLKEKFRTRTPPLEEHDKASVDIGRLLQMEIQCFTASHDDPPKPSWKSLKSSIDSAWQQKRMEKMKECVFAAATEIEQTLKIHTENWIKTDLNLAVATKTCFLSAYLAALKESVERHRSQVHHSAWEEFVDRVDAKCRGPSMARLTPIQQTVSAFMDAIERRFSYPAYFFPDDRTVLDISRVEFHKISHTLPPKNIFVHDAVEHACDKLFQEYRDLVLVANKIKSKDVVPKLTRLYKIKMKNFYLNDSPLTPRQLKSLHDALCTKCVEAFGKAYVSFDNDLQKRLVNSHLLKDDLTTYFVKAYEQPNSDRFQVVEMEINKVTQKLATQHDKRMKEFLERQKQSGAMDESELERRREHVVKELLQVLEDAVRSKVKGDEEYLERCKNSLRTLLSSGWNSILQDKQEKQPSPPCLHLEAGGGNKENKNDVKIDTGGVVAQTQKFLDAPK